MALSLSIAPVLGYKKIRDAKRTKKLNLWGLPVTYKIQNSKNMKKRMLHMSHLKPECIESYRQHHLEVWPELEALYRQGGILQVSCFLHADRLLVFSEYDDEKYPASKEWISNSEVQKKWSQLMGPLADPATPSIEFEEVYHMAEEAGTTEVRP